MVERKKNREEEEEKVDVLKEEGWLHADSGPLPRSHCLLSNELQMCCCWGGGKEEEEGEEMWG